MAFHSPPGEWCSCLCDGDLTCLTGLFMAHSCHRCRAPHNSVSLTFSKGATFLATLLKRQGQVLIILNLNGTSFLLFCHRIDMYLSNLYRLFKPGQCWLHFYPHFTSLMLLAVQMFQMPERECRCIRFPSMFSGSRAFCTVVMMTIGASRIYRSLSEYTRTMHVDRVNTG